MLLVPQHKVRHLTKWKLKQSTLLQCEDTAVEFSPSETVSIFSDETTCTESKETQTCETTTQYKAGAETVKENETYVKSLEERVSALRTEIQNQEFSIKRFQNDDSSISFYTGFPNYETLLACFSLVVDKARNMSYGKYHRKQFNTLTLESPGVPRSLSLLDEFFLVLVRIRLGLLERDLSDMWSFTEHSFKNSYQRDTTLKRRIGTFSSLATKRTDSGSHATNIQGQVPGCCGHY